MITLNSDLWHVRLFLFVSAQWRKFWTLRPKSKYDYATTNLCTYLRTIILGSLVVVGLNVLAIFMFGYAFIYLPMTLFGLGSIMSTILMFVGIAVGACSAIAMLFGIIWAIAMGVEILNDDDRAPGVVKLTKRWIHDRHEGICSTIEISAPPSVVVPESVILLPETFLDKEVPPTEAPTAILEASVSFPVPPFVVEYHAPFAPKETFWNTRRLTIPWFICFAMIVISAMVFGGEMSGYEQDYETYTVVKSVACSTPMIDSDWVMTVDCDGTTKTITDPKTVAQYFVNLRAARSPVYQCDLSRGKLLGRETWSCAVKD
jgi:hypothetical protein